MNIQEQQTVNDRGRDPKLQSTQHGGAWGSSAPAGKACDTAPREDMGSGPMSRLGMGCHAGLQDPEQKVLFCVACGGAHTATSHMVSPVMGEL